VINALVVSNGIAGLDAFYVDDDLVRYQFRPTTRDFTLDLRDTDLLIVPNGSDHVAMLKARDQVGEFVRSGGSLMCTDGWFTDWIPGHRWVMENSRPTKEVRYFVQRNDETIVDDEILHALIWHHGISGWWACGYIQSDDPVITMICDTWDRPENKGADDESLSSGAAAVTAV